MADIKLQAYRGESGPTDIDFRKSTGGFKGSPEDEHRTIAEVRVDDDFIDRQIEVVDPETDTLLLSTSRRNAIAVANSILADVTQGQPDELGNVADLVGLEGSGPVKLAIRIYDND